ncbi:hypothetical protein ACWELY_11050, partial [Streptomyces sp. NPDC004599]
MPGVASTVAACGASPGGVPPAAPGAPGGWGAPGAAPGPSGPSAETSWVGTYPPAAGTADLAFQQAKKVPALVEQLRAEAPARI